MTVSLIVGLALALPAIADDPTFFEIRPFGRGADYLRSVATGDMNNDGYLDLVGDSRVYLNDGEGGFFNGTATCGVTTNVRCYGNDDDNVNSVAVGDLNNDGALDIVIADSGANLKVAYINTGAGVFTTTAPYTRSYGPPTAATYGMAVGDMNNDGHIDIVVGNYNQQSGVYLNNGTGVFTTTAMSCANPSVMRCFGGITNTVAIAVGDLNNDGRLDIVATNRAAQITAYLNDGSGNFATIRNIGGGTNGPSTFDDSTLALGDLNNDGWLDVVTRISSVRGAIFFNTGSGNFATTTVTCGVTANVECVGTGGDDIFSVATADFNNDGSLDVALGNYNQQNVLYLNDGTGNFHYGAITCNYTLRVMCFGAGEDSSIGLAAADINSDGALDLVVGNNDGQQSNVYLNNGAGLFPTGQVWGASANQPAQVAVGDVNGDGFLDFASANVGNQQSLIYLNNGAGGFYSGAADCALTASMRCLGPASNSLSALAFGDFNGDGHLDAAVNPSAQAAVYLNNGTGVYTTSAVSCASPTLMRCFGPASAGFQDLVPGDINGDGYLDIVAGRSVTGMVFLNNGSGTFTSGTITCGVTANVKCFGNTDHGTEFIVVGDVDKDGDLDLAVGNNYNQNAVYLNDGAGNFYSGPVVCGVTAGVRCVGSVPPPGDFGTNGTLAIALSDVNGDGFLDFVEGNAAGSGQQNIIYINDGTGTFYYGQVTCGVTPNVRCFGTGGDSTWAMAVGDMNGDGMPDIVEGNPSQQNAIYLNDGAGNFPRAATWLFDPSSSLDDMRAIAVGDLNNDGALDLVAGNYFGNQNMVYLNTLAAGRLANNPPSVGVSRPSRNAAFLSDAQLRASTTIPITYTLFDPEGDRVKFIRAHFSPDGGGQWFPAVAAGGTVTSNLTTNYVYTDSKTVGGLTYNWIDISTTGTAVALTDDSFAGPFLIGFPFSFYNQSWTQFWIDSNGWIAFTDPTGISALASRNNVSLPNSAAPTNMLAPLWDDLDPGAGGSIRYLLVDSNTLVVSYIGVPIWNTVGSSLAFQIIIRRNGTITYQYQTMNPGAGSLNQATIGIQNNARTLGQQVVYNAAYVTNTLAGKFDMARVFNWDVAASGFFGQSNNMVFRLEAYPDTRPITNGVPGPYQRPYLAAQTFPFRVRGTQVRVMSTPVNPAVNALVYRLPAGQTVGGQLLTNSATGLPFRTDAQGYLQGRGELVVGDKLLALLPIVITDAYTLYYTNAAPTATGVNATAATASGIQTLTVSAANPLYLFNLNVALEWDASHDPTYLDELQFNLQRTSQYLYDFTNGQAALGQVSVSQNADDWAYAHVTVKATNRQRPFAAQGGLITVPITDPQHSTIVYSPGQVTMGASWNRYGTPGASIGDDWALILAHELGHYLFFHDDTYLGLDANGKLISVATCKGSAMGDIYNDPEATEFIADEAVWQAKCKDTLPEKTLQRNEWETLKLWYPALITPTVLNTGPSLMPFNLTRLQVYEPLTPTNALDDPTFYLDYVNNGVSSTEARAYLIRNNQFVVDLGSPFGGQNRVIARGAQPGDRLCVFDRPWTQYGCETIEQGDDRLQMEQDATWTPVIQITPVDTDTLNIQIQSLPISLSLQARLFTEYGSGGAIIALTEASGNYTGAFNLSEAAMAGHVQVWVNEGFTETNPRRETIVAFSIGGNPGALRGGGGALRGGGGALRGGGGALRGGGGALRGGGAPVISPDGQMIFFSPDPIQFDPGEFYTIQGMAGLPPTPPGRVVIGQGYSLVATPGTPVLTGSVSIQYLANDVLNAGATENQLTIYFYDGVKWTALDTVRDEYFNLDTAPSRGVGLYALMASAQIPLRTPGWNLFAYPVPSTQVLTQALLSLGNVYTTVYSYEPERNPTDPWRMYDKTAPAWANDLATLEYGRGYWINVTQAITLHLAPKTPTVYLPAPPTTFYGRLVPRGDFAPAPGQTLTAWVNNNQCGETTTQAVDGQIVYVVDVLSSCATPGEVITFRVAGYDMAERRPWDNQQIWALDLNAANHLYLPVIAR